MWFEILPCATIITVAMAVPHVAAYVFNYLVVGNFYRRGLVTTEQRRQYLRDRRLTGHPYKILGLENIPDCDNGGGQEGGGGNDGYVLPTSYTSMGAPFHISFMSGTNSGSSGPESAASGPPPITYPTDRLRPKYTCPGEDPPSKLASNRPDTDKKDNCKPDKEATTADVKPDVQSNEEKASEEDEKGNNESQGVEGVNAEIGGEGAKAEIGEAGATAENQNNESPDTTVLNTNHPDCNVDGSDPPPPGCVPETRQEPELSGKKERCERRRQEKIARNQK